MHTCPDSDGPVPHVGGPIMSGSPNVFIGNLPAARVSDKVTCVGPPDMIAMGSPTVLINGLMAARMGDQTAHGGVIVGGLTSVLIGTAAGSSSPLSSQGGALAQAAKDGGTPFCEHCTK
ncbi:PAAR domain-containing protein [Acidiphilium sp.]|uniref:PAAR domain-containing protein n=1 Tax=Acidiphilium sp. TaxID=527 RepID=UPI003CFD7801